MKEELNDTYKLDLGRSLALGVTTAGALGSLILTLRAGWHNDSVILKLLFSVWVLLPFIGLIISGVISRRWFPRTRLTLYILMMVISFASLLFYSGLFSFSGFKPAFAFLVIPLISWIIMPSVYAFHRRY